MKILMHTMACPDHTPFGALELAQTLELDGIELVCQPGYACGIDPSAPLADARSLATEARRIGTNIHALTPYSKGLNSPDVEFRQAAMAELDHCLSLASELGASIVRIFAGAKVAPEDKSAALRRFIESSQKLGDKALSLGLDLCIENHMDTMALSAAETVEVVEATAHPAFGIVYDQGNLDFMRAEAFPLGLELQRPMIRHVHVKDFRWESDGRRTAAVVGAGILPWNLILRSLDSSGYNRFLTLEFERRWFPDQLPIAAIGVAQSRDVLRTLLREISAERTAKSRSALKASGQC